MGETIETRVHGGCERFVCVLYVCFVWVSTHSRGRSMETELHIG